MASHKESVRRDREQRRERLAERKRAQRRKEQRRKVLVVGLPTLVAIGLIAVVIVVIAGRKSATDITGLQKFSNLARDHVTTPVHYPQTPPVGGPHNPVLLNCGVYSKPVPNENAVHDLEHGAVWITYRPGLATDQVARLAQVAAVGYVTVSPYPGLPTPVVASAWGRQLRLPSATDPRLDQFVKAFRQGPQTPEPGAPCSGGVGQPVSP